LAAVKATADAATAGLNEANQGIEQLKAEIRQARAIK
jgi:hypothetical protein